MTKPQHEQDYETVFGWVQALHAESDTRKIVEPALSRLHAEAAKVPGLEAELTQRTRERDSEMEERWKVSEVKRQHAARAEQAESERDAYKRDLDAEMQGTMALRRELGAQDNETFPGFVHRLASERDTVRQERDEARDEVERVDRLYDAVADVLDAAGIAPRLDDKGDEDGSKQAERVKELAGLAATLRERVATLERERAEAYAKWADANRYLGLLDETLSVAGDDTDTLIRGFGKRLDELVATEARVKELTEKLAGARNAALEEAANLLDNVDSANPASLIRSLAPQPPPAFDDPAQDVAAMRAALASCSCETVEPCEKCLNLLDAVDRATGAMTTPTPPALVNAVGPRITPVERLVDVARRLASGASNRMVYEDLDAALTAYDAANGGLAREGGAEALVQGPNWRARRNFWRRRYQDERDLQRQWKFAMGMAEDHAMDTDAVVAIAEDAAKYRAAVERAKDASALQRVYQCSAGTLEESWLGVARWVLTGDSSNGGGK